MTEPPARETPERSDRRALILVAAVLVGALVAIGVYAWRSLRDSGMSEGGYVALALGILVTGALAAGLMALLFYSQRRGYDDAAGGGSGEPD